MKYAYLRLSTKKQNLETERNEILKYHSDVEQWVEEKTCVFSTKPELTLLINRILRPGDQLVVYSLSRIASNCIELHSLLEEFEKKNIGLVSVHEEFDFSLTATGKLLCRCVAAMANFEGENSFDRQRNKVMIKLEDPRLFEIYFERYTNLKGYKMKDFQASTGLKEKTLSKFLRLRRELGQPFPN